MADLGANELRLRGAPKTPTDRGLPANPSRWSAHAGTRLPVSGASSRRGAPVIHSRRFRLPALTSVRISQADSSVAEGAAGWIREDPFDRRLPLPLTLSYTRIFEIPIAICHRACNFFWPPVRRACDACVCNLRRDARKFVRRTKPAKWGRHSSLPLAREPVEALPNMARIASKRASQSRGRWGARGSVGR
jgi:hypothetical protein